MEQNELNSMIDKYKNDMMHTYNRANPPAAPSVPALKTYDQFLNSNTKTGTLKVQAFTARQALPVKDVNVEVTKQFLDLTKTFFDLKTDENGIIDNMELPAPDKSLSENENFTGPVYETYDIKVTHPDFEDLVLEQVTIFDGVKSIQPVNLVPRS